MLCHVPGNGHITWLNLFMDVINLDITRKSFWRTNWTCAGNFIPPFVGQKPHANTLYPVTPDMRSVLNHKVLRRIFGTERDKRTMCVGMKKAVQ